jgi:hypothetical protein
MDRHIHNRTPTKEMHMVDQQHVPDEQVMVVHHQSKAVPTTTAPRLPLEILLLIVGAVCLLPDPCRGCMMKSNFDCPALAPWFCKFTHGKAGESIPALINPNITSVCRSFRHRAFMTYYRYNTFLFNSTGGDAALLFQTWTGTLDVQWEDLRDPRATRLLDFIDRPEWKNTGSWYFEDAIGYEHCDEYRHLIRRMVIVADPVFDLDDRPDSDWGLKIDWQTLPDLQYLQLDLREFCRSSRNSQDANFAAASYEILATGARRMRCLKLKRLVLVGLLRFRPHWRDEKLIKGVEQLFRPAMAPGGEIRCRDPLDVIW